MIQYKSDKNLNYVITMSFFQFVINASVPELSQQRTRIQKGCDLT